MKRHKIMILAAFTLSFAVPLMAQTAEKIVNRYVAAIGGKVALENIRTMKIIRDFEYVEDNRIQRGTYYFKRPDFYRYEAGTGIVCLVVSGEKAWRKTRESADLPWQPWEEIKHGTRYILDWLGPFLDHGPRGIELEYIERKKEDGADLFHLRMITPNGRRSDVYFDAESGLYVRLNDKRIMDYRPVDGVLFPFREEGKITLPSGIRQTISTIIGVEINLLLEDSFFAPEKGESNK